MEATGQGRLGVLVVAEAPGAEEDRQGVQLVGRAGKVLRLALRSLGVDLDRDCVKINAVNCRPMDSQGRNRTPTDTEIQYCRPRVWNVIRRMKPRVILLLGEPAVKSFLAHRWVRVGETLEGISRWRGWCIPDQEVGAWVCPTYHPSYVMRNEKEPVVGVIWRQDLERALSLIHTEVPRHEPQVELLWEQHQVVSVLKEVYGVCRSEGQLLAFDYETTGLKPYRPGHRVLCVGLCVDGKVGYCFPWQPEWTEAQKWWKRILLSPSIPKTAHNMKFENLWSRVALGTEVVGWHWCSLQAAHIQDNRPYVSGLKFQVYVNFGILGYDAEVASYLDADLGEKIKYGANAFNRASQCPLDKLMYYCAQDALYQYWLAMEQIQSIEQQCTKEALRG